jgi:hypothetical protein
MWVFVKLSGYISEERVGTASRSNACGATSRPRRRRVSRNKRRQREEARGRPRSHGRNRNWMGFRKWGAQRRENFPSPTLPGEYLSL